MSLRLIETNSPLFIYHNGPTKSSAAGTEESQGVPTLDGCCPRCKTQLMWTRKKFNMGIKFFFESCPKCLPDTIVNCSPREATKQIETLLPYTTNLAALEDLDAVVEHLDHTRSVTEILHVMKGHQECVRVQAMACKKLGQLTHESSKNVSNVVDADGINIVLQGMRQYPKASTLQSHALLALGNIASDSHRNRHMIGNSGGIDLMLSATGQHPNNIKVQRSGLFAIGNVSKTHNENTTQIGQKGGIELVLIGMNQFRNDVQVQRNGLFAICNLAYNNASNKTRIGYLEGIVLVMSSMQQFPEDLNIQRAGLPALGNLTSTNAKNRSMVGDLGGVDMVLESMTRFPVDAIIQEMGCCTIAFLARSPKLRSELKRKGAAKHVKAAKKVIIDKTCAVNALRELEKGSMFRGFLT